MSDSTDSQGSESFSSHSIFQQRHSISISISCLWSSTDQPLLPFRGHTHLTQQSSPHFHAQENGAGSALLSWSLRGAKWRWGSAALTYSYGCPWYIYQFHLRHSFQGNWGKDLLQEGLFLPQAVEGCLDVRQDDAGSYPTLWLAGNVLSQAFCRLPEWENSPSASK